MIEPVLSSWEADDRVSQRLSWILRYDLRRRGFIADDDGIVSFHTYFLGGVFFLACGIFGVILVNIPIWTYTETLPSDYYLFGKFMFAVILFFEFIYTIFFHVLPIMQNEKNILAKNKKSDSQ